jgi:predicted dienelactone hydrolase
MHKLLLIITIILNFTLQVGNASENIIEARSSNLFDKERQRQIPIETYVSKELEAKAKAGITKLPIAIINHGYTIKNTEYSFIAESLAAQGYFVISIQHDLPSDSPLPTIGSIYERRKPLWERGVKNILFVIQQYKNTKPYLDFTNLTLIGHSNGGDISILFATLESNIAKKVISLDSRRMPFPKTSNTKILSLRSNDQTADEGVLPTKEEQKKFGIKIIKLNIKHDDFCDRGPSLLLEKINVIISKFLKDDL